MHGIAPLHDGTPLDHPIELCIHQESFQPDQIIVFDYIYLFQQHDNEMHFLTNAQQSIEGKDEHISHPSEFWGTFEWSQYL